MKEADVVWFILVAIGWVGGLASFGFIGFMVAEVATKVYFWYLEEADKEKR